MLNFLKKLLPRLRRKKTSDTSNIAKADLKVKPRISQFAQSVLTTLCNKYKYHPEAPYHSRIEDWVEKITWYQNKNKYVIYWLTERASKYYNKNNNMDWYDETAALNSNLTDDEIKFILHYYKEFVDTHASFQRRQLNEQIKLDHSVEIKDFGCKSALY